MSRIEEEYEGYRLVAAELGRVPTARAFRIGGSGANPIAHEAQSHSVDAALTALKAKIDAARQHATSARRSDAVLKWSVPTEDEYAAALPIAGLSSAQMTMLHAHAKSGEEGMTAGELAASAGYDDYEVANSVYGRAGAALGAALRVTTPISPNTGKPVHTGVLAAEGLPRPDCDHFVWVMHPELRLALLQQED